VERSVLLRNVLALYSVHSFNYIFPLLTVPFLTRVLGPAGWGGVAFAQSLGAVMVLFIEYGFALSASREVAVRRDDRAWLSRTLGAVTAAKSVLSAAALIAALGCSHYVAYLREHPALFWAAVLGAIAQGMSPIWFYQGLERLGLTSTVDIVCKSAGLITIFALIRSPSQGWLVLGIYACAALAATVIVYVLAIREFGIRRPSSRQAFEELRRGFTLFLFKGSVALYTSGNVFILGLMAGPEAVAAYAAAERITKSALGLLGPLNQALYPHVNRVLRDGRDKAARLVRRVFTTTILMTSLLAIVLIALAPPVVRILLGSGFRDSVSPLRILALLLPVIGASNVLGVQWMLPLHRDKAFNALVISAGIINLILACLLAPQYGASGMAAAVLSAETFVTAGCIVYVIMRHVNPFSLHALSTVAVDQSHTDETAQRVN
jgi:PST family polysaccharide transporter